MKQPKKGTGKRWQRALSLLLTVALLAGMQAMALPVRAEAEPAAQTSESAEGPTPDPTAETIPLPGESQMPATPAPTDEASAQPTAPDPTGAPTPTADADEAEPQASAAPSPTATSAAATASPTAAATATASPGEEGEARAATPESAQARASAAIPSNHLDVQAASSFYMRVDQSYYYVQLDLRTRTATVYTATAQQAEAMRGEHGAQTAQASDVSCTVDVSQLLDGESTTLYQGYAMTNSSQWQQQTGGGMEYRFNGRENGNDYTFYQDALYTVTLHIAFGFAAGGSPVEVDVAYSDQVGYHTANNSCPGSGRSRGIDIQIDSSELSSFFTRGQLTLVKNVPEAAGDTTQFRFRVWGPTDQPDTAASFWQLDAQGDLSATTDETSAVTVAANDSCVLDDLPAGHYVITEVDIPDGYAAQDGVVRQEVDKLPGQSRTVQFTNLRVTQGVILRKSVDGQDDPASFVFRLYRGTDTTARPAGIYTAPANANLIMQLAAGEYTLVEAASDVYTSWFTVNGVTTQGQATFTVPSGTMLSVAVDNRTITRSLTIEKQVTGTTAADVDFTFAVELSAEGSYEYQVYNADQTPAGQGSLSGGDSLTLRAGQRAVIAGLPNGAQYAVRETALPDEYEQSEARNAEGTLTADQTATFVNAYVPTRTLTIRKRVEGTSARDVDFTFVLSLGTQGSYPGTVYAADGSALRTLLMENQSRLTLQAGQYAVIEGLPQGVEYAVREQALPAGYRQSSAQNAEGTLEDDTAAVFVNRYTAAATLRLRGQKTLLSANGQALQAGQFTFVSQRTVQGDEQTAQNEADGSFAFVYHYTEKDAGQTYRYRISEQAQTDACDYDPAVYILQVTVTDRGDGTLALTQELTHAGQAAEALTFANRCQTVRLTVNKLWDDDGDAAGARPQSVQMTLYATAQGSTRAVETVTLKEDGGWSHSWQALPRYDDRHQEIHYSLTEGDSKDYRASYAVSAPQTFTEQGQTVGYAQTVTYTNTYVDPDPDDEDDEDDDDGGEDDPAPTAAPTAAAAAAVLRAAQRVQTGDTAPAQIAISLGMMLAAGLSLALMHRKKR